MGYLLHFSVLIPSRDFFGPCGSNSPHWQHPWDKSVLPSSFYRRGNKCEPEGSKAIAWPLDLGSTILSVFTKIAEGYSCMEGAVHIAIIWLFLLHLSRQTDEGRNLHKISWSLCESWELKTHFMRNTLVLSTFFPWKALSVIWVRGKNHNVSTHLPHSISSSTLSGCLSEVPAWKSFWHKAFAVKTASIPPLFGVARGVGWSTTVLCSESLLFVGSLVCLTRGCARWPKASDWGIGWKQGVWDSSASFLADVFPWEPLLLSQC